jgi:hypothetical protein
LKGMPYRIREESLGQIGHSLEPHSLCSLFALTNFNV